MVADSPDAMSLRDDRIILTRDDNDHTLPVDQVGLVMISGSKGSFSLPLVQSLLGHSASLILCDKKHQPAGVLLPVDGHSESAGHLIDQAAWSDRRRDAVWADLVRIKLRRQRDVLALTGHSVPSQLNTYINEIRSGDATNREAMGARVYFNALFGDGFRRHAEDDTNAALDYGYAIIRSAVSRSIALHGYSTALGIHHRSRQNQLNLACDIMEPFRPFVDRIVAQDPGRLLDWPYRQALVQVLKTPCRLDDETMQLDDAIDSFVLQVVNAMETPRGRLKGVAFD